MMFQKRLVIGAFLSCLVSFAQGDQGDAREADPRAKEFLRKVLELARLPDLMDVTAIEKAMGFRLERLFEEVADLKKMPGVKWRKQSLYLVEGASFPMSKSAMELARSGSGKISRLSTYVTLGGENSMSMFLFLAHGENGACLTENDMVAVFGPKPRRGAPSLHSDDAQYGYFHAERQTSVYLRFPHDSPCIDEVLFNRNFPMP